MRANDDASHRLRRSLEYVPAYPDNLKTAAESSLADVICIDLEDSVAPQRKAEARAGLAGMLAGLSFRAAEVLVRVNGRGTDEHEDDIAACNGLPIDGVVLPKVDTPLQAAQVRGEVNEALGLWCMIETAEGCLEARGIAAVLGVEALLVGGHDLAENLGVPLRAMAAGLAPYYVPIVLAARAAGVSAIAPVAMGGEPDDVIYGFDGRSTYHGQDIAAINRLFSPTEAEVQAARDMISGGRIFGDHLHHAERLIHIADAIAMQDARR
ncbi:MAG: aldolase/citrate lyase family protein [Novosphingobium sp.]|nr:aldolase/citrate lyase family protein [Novosphingobium sp.]